MFIEGFQNFLDINVIVFSAVGMVVGIIFGVIPGLAANIGIVLFLPVTYILQPMEALLLLLGIFCGATYGGSVTAILLGTPGTNSAAATVLDGYELTKKNQAWKSLMMALVASVIGGIISALLLLIAAPLVASVTIKFAPPELFTISVFGLSVIAAVSGKNFWKGLIGGALGMLLSTVGSDTMSGKTRFIFGNIKLSTGLSMSAVLLGIFAICVILDKARDIFDENQEDIKKIVFSHDDKLSLKEIRQCVPLMMKSSVIGCIIGIIPGVGAGIASILSYNEAKRVSKTPEKFGTGFIEGVAAPEAANNAVTGSALIPTLTLGIPGAPAAATLMAAFTIHGLVPGPLLFKNSGSQMYSIMIGFLFLNIIMLFIGYVMCRFFVNVVRVPSQVLIPILTLTCIAGAYSESGSMIQVYTLLAFGFLGYVFSIVKIPAIPIVLGFILGSLSEFNFRRSLVMSDQSLSIFFKRPICIFFILLTVVFIITLTADTKKIKEKFTKSKG
ncbi:tripartite tricarboxylate transporter permease [Clostridium sp. chh4-2]|uniref:tripartite tricarboxylate transporter permease n=1 Tax=Clostridium sp. chh4-2 TaxID=2067550 RepID=UPI001FA8D71F|nr:tripartite tricarboxylate transporter permease [Clostridium sp. chh4-2]